MKIFRLPDLGEGLQEAEIVEWRVKPRAAIAVDEPLVAVETAKAVVEIPSPHRGARRTPVRRDRRHRPHRRAARRLRRGRERSAKMRAQSSAPSNRKGA